MAHQTGWGEPVEDIFSMYMADPPTAAEKAQAMAQALAGQQQQAQQMGGLGRMMALHPLLQQPARALTQDSQFGQNQAQQGQEMLGRAGQFRAGQLGEDKRQGAQFTQQKEMAGINNAAEWARLQAQLGAKKDSDAAEKTDKAAKSLAELRKEYLGLAPTKAIMEQASVYRQIPNAPADGTGDMTLVYGLAKMYDPGGRVTDADANMAQSTGGKPGKLLGWLEEVRGTGKLSDKTRVEIKKEAKRVMKEKYLAHKQLEDFYRGQATKQNLMPEDVVPGLGLELDDAPGAGGGVPAGRQPVMDKSGKLLGYINADGSEELVK